MRFVLLTLLLSVGACKKKAKTPDFMSIPHLPSPTAGTYASVPSAPQDEVVLALAPKKVQWDASLTGGAASLALGAVEGSGGLRRFEVREALWAAGYPYPAREVRGWSVVKGQAPPEEVRAWLEERPEAHYGLVRARSTRGDAWVGLSAEPRIDLGILPRSLDLGDRLTLPAVQGATLRVGDPSGTVHTSDLSDGRALTLSLPGEWVVEVRDDKGTAALFPVYVAVEAPEEPVLEPPEHAPVDAEELAAHVRSQLEVIRTAYDLTPFTVDFLLEQAALDAMNGQKPALEKLKARRLECRGDTVEDCLDRLLWDLSSRSVLVDAKVDFSGTAVVADMDGIRITLLLAG